MKLKKFLNRLGLGFFGSVAVIMILSVVGDFLPANGAKVYEPSESQIQAQMIYDQIAQDLVEAQLTSTTAKVAYDQALVTEKSIELTLCSQQLVLAQLKYQDTNPDNSVETERLGASIQAAKECLKKGF